MEGIAGVIQALLGTPVTLRKLGIILHLMRMVKSCLRLAQNTHRDGLLLDFTHAVVARIHPKLPASVAILLAAWQKSAKASLRT